MAPLMSSNLKQTDFIGVWQRQSIAINGGEPFEDARVFWLQTESYFADMRWPIAKSNDGEGAASAFAGRAEWRSPCMYFQHEIDLTKEFSEDIGQLSFKDNMLIEDGQVEVDGRSISFQEVWTPMSPSLNPETCSTALYGFDPKPEIATGPAADKGIIVRVSDYLIAMEEINSKISATLWHHAKGHWVTQYSLGQEQGHLLESLLNETLPMPWVVL